MLCWLVVSMLLVVGCDSAPPAESLPDETPPTTDGGAPNDDTAAAPTAMPTTAMPSQFNGDGTTAKSEAPPKPEFVTASQMRERLGVGEDANFERVGRGFVAAYLANSGVRDLSPLKGQELQLLAVAANPLTSLAGVEGMPLRIIDLSETKIDSLAPLADCNDLEQVFLESTLVSDLSPLKGKRLTHLYVTDCPVADLSPIAGMRFQELNLCRTKIPDLSAFVEIESGILWLRGTQISDLTPLAGSSLVSLDVQETQVSDLTPLAEIPSLQRLNIADTNVTDVTPLAKLPLSRLILSPGKISQGMDLLRAMPTLQEIDTQFEGEQPKALPASEFWERYDAGAFKTETAE
ncbi:MAG: hypothetical protein KDA58_05490 [Planctomycetaceae bacterium]|nr:hypothetical protein [Planctomycetaceae bacterium]